MKWLKAIFYVIYFTFIVSVLAFQFNPDFFYSRFGIAGTIRLSKILPAVTAGIMLSHWAIQNIHIVMLKRRNRRLTVENIHLKEHPNPIRKSAQPNPLVQVAAAGNEG